MQLGNCHGCLPPARPTSGISQRVIEMSVGELGLCASYHFADVRRRLDCDPTVADLEIQRGAKVSRAKSSESDRERKKTIFRL